MTDTRAEHHQLSNKEFKFICKLVYDNTGIVLDDRKQEMVYRRLMRRTRELRIASFSEYCSMLGTSDSEELPSFINAITTNLTSFFRENHHFDYLHETFIPQHMEKFSASKRLRIWSAACSTGEEPYSLAITLMKSMGAALDNWDVRILATDLDTDVLAAAQKGVYKADRIKDLSADLRKEWFRRGSGNNQSLVKVDPELQQLITFKPLNLLNSWPMRGPFDVIMCRNVLIYFDKETQKKLVTRYAGMLRAGGLLILGHSESLANDVSHYDLKGRTIFEKRPSLDTWSDN